MKDQLLVLYDGECVLCNSSVDFLLRRDTENIFLYAPLQRETGRSVLVRHDEDPDELDSIVYVRGFDTDDERIFRRSTAVLKALEDLGGVWRIMSWIMLIVPRVVRDFVYDIVAKYRYQWFGQYDECRIPSSAERDRFLD